jgi:hypothetical protein
MVRPNQEDSNSVSAASFVNAPDGGRSAEMGTGLEASLRFHNLKHDMVCAGRLWEQQIQIQPEGPLCR